MNRNSFFHLWVQYRDLSNKHEQKTKTGKFEGWVMEIVADKMWVQTQVTLIVERSCRSVSVHAKFHIFYNIYIYIYIYIYKYYERKKKGRNYISRQACFVNRFGKCSYVPFFSSRNIYPALLQRIEHCSTRKSTCRLPIYIYIYIVSWWKLKGSLLLSVFFQLDRWNPE